MIHFFESCPVDLLMSIFSYLDLMDVWYLSQLTPSFLSFSAQIQSYMTIMYTHHKKIWMTSLENEMEQWIAFCSYLIHFQIPSLYPSDLLFFENLERQIFVYRRHCRVLSSPTNNSRMPPTNSTWLGLYYTSLFMEEFELWKEEIHRCWLSLVQTPTNNPRLSRIRSCRQSHVMSLASFSPIFF